MTGRRGKEIRVNHVADHFHKEQKDIRQWVKYNDCNEANRAKELENAKARCEQDRNLGLELDPDSDQQRYLPPIKELFPTPGQVFHPSDLGPPPVPPQFWICCECKILAQSKPDFVYAMNLETDTECARSDHRIHKRCLRCSIARSQF